MEKINSTLELADGIEENFDPGLVRSFELAAKGHTADPSLVDYNKVKIRKDSVLLSGDAAFYTLQGEGPTMGFPAVFVRLHVCNLRCSWCDAYYTWNPESKEFWTEGKRWNFVDAALLIKGTWERSTGNASVSRRVVITGGEPLIQREQVECVIGVLNEYDKDHKWTVEWETNGTLMPLSRQLELDQFNVSPKLANSDNNAHQMVKPKVLKALNKANSTFKFVSMTNEDLAEIEQVYLPHIDEDKIIIMPQGVTEEEVSNNAKRIRDDVLKRGWRMMPRAQNIFWHGAVRGV